MISVLIMQGACLVHTRHKHLRLHHVLQLILSEPVALHFTSVYDVEVDGAGEGVLYSD